MKWVTGAARARFLAAFARSKAVLAERGRFVMPLGGGGQDSHESCPILSAGAVDDLADLPLAETELSRQSTVVAAVEPGADVPVTGVAL